MRTIERTGPFKRDYKREMRSRHGRDVEGLLADVLSDLVFDRQLSPNRHDHALTGNWLGHRDCHLKPDLVLIYKRIENDRLRLVRLGSHSELGL